MKEKLATIRSIVEKLADTSDSEEFVESLNDELDSLEVLADHIDNYDDFDLETWAEELRQLIEEMNDN
jgi:hypothetical protein